MNTIKEYINWNIVVWFMLFISVFVFFSCGATDDEKPDQMMIDSDILDETSPISESSSNQDHINVEAALVAQTFTVDATNSEAWTYFSFATGEVVTIENAMNSEDWDIGFQRTKVKLNGGTSGPGMGSVVMLTDTSFEDVNMAPEDGYVSDSTETLAIVPQSEMGWYIYTGPPTHWVLPLEDRIFVLKAADGTFAKIRFIGYYKDNQNKVDSGNVTFEYVHQPDGSRSL